MPSPRASARESGSHGFELRGQIPFIVRIADQGQNAGFIASDQRRPQVSFGFEMIMDAGALDPDVAGDLAKTTRVKSTLTHALFG